MIYLTQEQSTHPIISRYITALGVRVVLVDDNETIQFDRVRNRRISEIIELVKCDYIGRLPHSISNTNIREVEDHMMNLVATEFLKILSKEATIEEHQYYNVYTGIYEVPPI